MNSISGSLTEIPTHKPASLLKRFLSSHWFPSLMLAILLLIGFVSLGILQYWNNQALLQQQHNTAVQIAASQQQQALLLNYYTEISTLMANNNLLHAQPSDAVKLLADAQTLEVLRQLDADHKVGVMRFLYQTTLIGNDVHVIRTTEMDLHNAHLSNIDLRDTYLVGANMSGADLHNTNLSDATLIYTNLNNANLAGTNLQATDLHNVSLAGANLAGANLKDAVGLTADQISQARTLKGATMPDGSVHP
jgi:uncharacterized protein YjbI with pentapeptide repeats